MSDRLLGWLAGWRRTWTYRCSWNQLLLFGSVIRPIWRWPAVGYFVSQHKMSVDICSFISFLSSFFIQPLKQPIQIKEESRNTDTRPSKKRQHILFLLLPQPPSSKKGITKYQIHYCQQHYFETGKIYSTNRCWRSYGRIGADCFTTLRKKVNSINYTLGKLNFVWC